MSAQEGDEEVGGRDESKPIEEPLSRVRIRPLRAGRAGPAAGGTLMIDGMGGDLLPSGAAPAITHHPSDADPRTHTPTQSDALAE
ncbi:MAG: hypothetical protein AAGA81_23020, partial [Acidobacteriota bacterium]